MTLSSTLRAAAIGSVAAFSFAQLAQAQSAPFGDMTLSFDLGAQQGVDYEYVALGFSASGDLSGALGYQFDVYRLEYANYPDDDIYGLAVHVTYDLESNLSVGAYVGFENWEGSEYMIAGIEANYASGPLSIDASFAVYDDEDAFGGIGMVYDLNNGLSVGFELGHYSDYETTYAVSATKEFGNGMALSLHVIDPRDEGILYSVRVSKDFGNGAKFRRPDYLNLFSVW